MKKLSNSFQAKALSLVFALLFVGFVSNAQNKSILKVGETLTSSDKFKSPDGRYELNVGLLLWDNSTLKSVWQYQIERTISGTPSHLKLEEKGSLVLYNTEGKAIWSSASDFPNVKELKMLYDGNLIIYDTDNEPVWALRNPNLIGFESGGNGVFLRYNGTVPDPSRLKNQNQNQNTSVDLDDFLKKN